MTTRTTLWIKIPQPIAGPFRYYPISHVVVKERWVQRDGAWYVFPMPDYSSADEVKEGKHNG